MENLPITAQEYLFFYQPSYVLLCTVCRHGIHPGPGIQRHFRDQHQLKGELLRQIVAYGQSFQPVHPKDAQLPLDQSQALPQLTVLHGYQCCDCPYRTINRANIGSHGAKAGHKRPDGTGWHKVLLQTFMGGRYGRYWIVGEESTRPMGGKRGGDGFTAIIANFAAQDEKAQRTRWQTVQATGGIDKNTSYIKHMRWATHLQEKDMPTLRRCSELPPARDRLAAIWDKGQQAEGCALHTVIDSFERVLDRCIRRLPHVPRETLRWINSANPLQPATQPLDVKEHDSTTERYKRYWRRYLCYCVRAHRMGRAEAAAQQRVEFTDVQWDLLGRVVQLVDRAQEAPAEAGVRTAQQAEGQHNRHRRGSSSSSGGSSASEGGGDDKLDRMLFEFCIASIKQRVAFDEYMNPLLHFTAVLAIDRTSCAWKCASDFTGQLAGIVWCSRVLMLEHLFEVLPDDPAALTPGMLDDVLDEYRRWLADGSHTPFSTMIHWMAYGKGVRRQEGGLARVMWAGDTCLRFLGQAIELAAFRHAAARSVDEAEQLVNGLFFGRWAKWRGRLDLGRIVDSLQFEGAGRSFATNEANRWLRPGCVELAELGQATLWRAAGGWRRAAVLSYLSQLRAFREALLVAVHVWAGQPGRGPEMMTLKHCDTQQLARNVYVFHGEVMLVCDRDKTKALRGIGRKVARFLPARVGRLLLALVLLFAADLGQIRPTLPPEPGGGGPCFLAISSWAKPDS